MKKNWALLVVDFFSWVFAVTIAVFIRYDFNVASVFGWRFIALGLVMGGVALAVGNAVGIYRSRHKPGSFNEVTNLVITSALSFAPISVVLFFFAASWNIPRSIPVIATLIFLIVAIGARTANRLRKGHSQVNAGGKPVLVLGVGEMAEKLISQLLEDPESGFLPVGLVDDDPRPANRWISGVKILGSIDQLPELVAKSGATGIVVAIPRASAELLGKIRHISIPLGLRIYVLPTASEVLDNLENPIVLRDLSLEDLVDRRSIEVQFSEIDSTVRGKRVLVTGAGGSIGLELCKQLAAFHPSSLILVDHDDTSLHRAQLEMQNRGLNDSLKFVLLNIRDSEALDEIWERIEPEVVFHGAALKHLPILEAFPDEAWKTNVEGTLNVLQASIQSKVRTFVNVSTDKAVDPSSALGRSKRLAEQLTSWASTQVDGNYMSVRFGNVLGSRGSLVPTISYLLENDLPITITHPDVTRYFMTIPEACQLVLEAATQRSDGSIFILDMGEPVKVADLAQRMIELSGKNAKIVYTGLRAGEKLHETLHAKGEQVTKGNHGLIFRTSSSALSPADLSQARKSWSEAITRRHLESGESPPQKEG